MFIDYSGLYDSSLQRSEMHGLTYFPTITLRSAGAPKRGVTAKSINIWLLWSQNIENPSPVVMYLRSNLSIVDVFNC